MTSPLRSSRAQVFAVAGLILSVAVFRVLRATLLPDLPNFSPVMAMAFCGGMFLPGVLAWILPLAVLFLSDVALNMVLGFPVLGPGQLAAWGCFVAAVGAGRWLAGRETFQWGAFAGLLIGSGLVFYGVTNALCWLTNPLYPRGIEGLVQALTTGLPGYPPAWTFLRNSLFSDVLFTGVILAVQALAFRPARLVQEA